MTVPACANCHHRGDLVAVTRLRPTLHRALVCVDARACLARRVVDRAVRGRG